MKAPAKGERKAVQLARRLSRQSSALKLQAQRGRHGRSRPVGARTGGALVILGFVLLATALMFSSSVAVLLRLFPAPVLGVILFLTGAQLALGACDISKDKGERFVTMVTGALAIWNVGIAFLIGVAAYWLNKRGVLRI